MSAGSPDQAPERVPAPEHVAILGAGPVGLAAALAAADAGWPFTVFECAPGIGGNVARWGHVKMFTPWSMNVSEPMARHLRAAGHPVPDDETWYPTGAELVSWLLEPLAALPELAGRIVCDTRVVAVGRQGLLKHEEIGTDQRARHPFRLVLQTPGGTRVASASLVLDCTGTYATPNAAGDGGVPAPGEEELTDRIVRALPDFRAERDSWAGRTILLLGAGKSAQTAARDLAALVGSAPDTYVVWAVRGDRPDWGEVPDDPLPQRQALVESSRWLAARGVSGVRVLTGVAVDAFKPGDGRILVRLHSRGGDPELAFDRVLSLTGYVPDASLYRQLQVHECYATTAPYELSAQLLGDAAGDCLAQSSHGVDVLRNPEPNFFVLGAKSYGRNSQFLLRNGYAQVAEVAAGYRPAGG